MQLYSGPLSLFTAKVRIALDEKELEYERIEVPFTRADGYAPKHPAVLEHNPKAQVPVLVDEDLVLFDSTVIVEYLDDVAPNPPLLPGDARERARCRMAELYADEVFFPLVWPLVEGVFYGASHRDGDLADARERIVAQYEALDRALEKRDWIGAETFNAADVAYRLVILFASTLGAPPSPELPSLAGWIARIDARPSVAREIEGLMKAAADLSR